MAHEEIATNAAFAKAYTYLSLPSYTILNVGSDSIAQYYGAGHRGKWSGTSKPQAFVDNAWAGGLYYKTSDSSTTWHHSPNTNALVSEGSSVSRVCDPAQSHLLRWRFRITISGDHKAWLSAYFTTTSMYYINHALYPQGRHLKVGILAAKGANPTYKTESTIYGRSSFLIYKP